jgi:putative acetyltransferase
MPSPLVIRPERPDRPEVGELLAALDRYLGSLYPPEANHILDVQALLAPEVRFVVAWLGERIVGCGATRRMPGEDPTGGRPYGEIKRMYVDPAVRGHGIAARLLGELEDGLRGDGIRLALLETGRDQHQAVRLYRRSGYVERGAFGGYPDNGLSLFMAKELGA